MSVNVVCLKWGKKYGAEYVNKLYSGVLRNSTLPFEFYCFTEDSSGLNDDICVQPLPFKELTGWWHKLYFYSRDFPIKGKILYIDLDTVITGNIDEIMLAEGFIVLRDFYAEKAQGVSTIDMGSGLMTWEGDYSEIWDKFIVNPATAINSLRPHGDQRWIQKFVEDRKYWQDELPGQVVSFKVHCEKGLPNDARVICYHGKPSIPDSIARASKGWRSRRIPSSAWVGEYWCG